VHDICVQCEKPATCRQPKLVFEKVCQEESHQIGKFCIIPSSLAFSGPLPGMEEVAVILVLSSIKG